jgi:hypothetical protein
LLALVASWRRADKLASDASAEAKRNGRPTERHIYDNRAAVFRLCADDLEKILGDRSLERSIEIATGVRMDPGDGGKQLCPHDGGTCHHSCTDSCFRMEIGAELTKPWPGFPVPGNRPVILNPLPDELGEDGFTPDELAAHEREREKDCSE